MSVASSHDPLPRRLIALGCALMAVPCLLAGLAVAIFGSPFFIALLPREKQPVAPARPGEALILVTTFTGQSGDNPASAIDSALLDLIGSTYLPTARVGRLPDTPRSDQEAQELGQHYQAAVVLWGTYDATTYTVNYAIPRPLSDLEPHDFAFTLQQGDTSGLDDLARFSLAVSLFHIGDAYNAGTYLGQVPYSGLDATVLTYYRVETTRQQNGAAFALPVVETALSGDPQNASLLILKASLLVEMTHYDDALEAVNAALAAEPERVEAYRLRGTIYRELGRYAEAIADFDHVLEATPESGATLRERAQTYQAAGDVDSALADYASLIALQPDDYQNYLARAEIYTTQGQQSPALADYAKALELAEQAAAPDTARIQVLEARARALRTFGEYEQALADYSALYNLDPYNSSRYLLERGMVYWEMGDPQSADREWKGYMSAVGYGLDAAGYNNLAWDLALAEYYEPALGYVEQSLRLDPIDPNALHTSGYVHLGLKEYQAALVDFLAAQRNGLTYDPVYRDIADAYAGLGMYDLAAQNYQTYLQRMPYAEDRAEVEQRLAEAQAATQP